MRSRSIVDMFGRRETFSVLAGGLLSVAGAAALFTRFSINLELTRDEGIYVYGGQMLARGVPPYVSIFDPKTPVATLLCGAAAAFAKLVHRNDVYAIRAAFLGVAVLTVLAVYLLVVRMFGSVLGGLTAALALAASWPLAVDALAGPDAKAPGVLFEVLTLWCIAERRWFLATAFGSAAAMVWQPLIVFPAVAFILAVATSGEGRARAALRALAGGALPVVVLAAYFALVGALRPFVETALVFPLVGARRAHETVPDRVVRISGVVNDAYQAHGLLFWVGSALLFAVVAYQLLAGRTSWRSPVGAALIAAAVTFLGELAYAAFDFQSYPDLYPFLPFPAIGFGASVALAARWIRPRVVRLVAGAATLVVLVAAGAFTWVSYTNDPTNVDGMSTQRVQACALLRARVPGTALMSLGSPVPLAMTRLRNPDNYVYLGSGIDRWKAAHTVGGVSGWQAEVKRAAPSLVVISGWAGPYRAAMEAWLRGDGYQVRYVGNWRTFFTPQAHARTLALGVRPTRHASDHVHAVGGGRVRFTSCQ